MQQVRFRFFAELNDLLTPLRGERELPYPFGASPSVKDAIEAFGVPHTEVDLILVNGEPVPFSCLLRNGDRISVYPVFRRLELGTYTHLQPEARGEIRFVLDVHLGRLAAYLRMLGFDTSYRNDFADDELASISATQHRTLLSRDRGLLKRSVVTRGYMVRETQPSAQLIEIVERFDLCSRIAPFRRCLHCNELLHFVEKERVNDRLLLGIRRRHNHFHLCPNCNRIYWTGSHYQRMIKLVERVTASKRPGATLT